MIDPLLSVAFSVYQNKGACALLLGSGVSRAAGIPTGWEVVLDLICKVAAAPGEQNPADPEAWYIQKYGEQPSYSGLLSKLAPTDAERRLLLRGYFDPSEEDTESGKKNPTKAHHAIARLVKGGYVKVILTTNFDRLMERALEQEGVTPTVVSTPDAAKGVLPLHLNTCTVVKLNGDYLDTGLKNTASELAQYDPAVEALIDRVLDEYGLIVCGWSGEWDTALRAAIERCQSHRFTTYWTVRGNPDKGAKRLLELRRAVPVSIADADSFFAAVAEKVVSLAEVDAPHPLSAKTAVAALKRYIVNDEHRIRLHDLVMGETERAFRVMSGIGVPVHRDGLTEESVPSYIATYQTALEILLPLVVHGCYWGGTEQVTIWSRVLERTAHIGPSVHIPNSRTRALLKYPAWVLLYAAGLSALAANRLATLAGVLSQTVFRDEYDVTPLTVALMERPKEGLDTICRCLPGFRVKHVPLSEHLFRCLREPFRQLVPSDVDYERQFDRFEYVHALVHADLREQSQGRFWAPSGRFVRRHSECPGSSVVDEIGDEIKALGGDWPPLRAGLFGGDAERLLAVKTKLNVLLFSPMTA